MRLLRGSRALGFQGMVCIGKLLGGIFFLVGWMERNALNENSLNFIAKYVRKIDMKII